MDENERASMMGKGPHSVEPQSISFREASKKLLRLAGPVMLTNIVNFGRTVISQVALGHISATHLAAGSLGMMLCNITSLSLIRGLLSGQDTLCSQAFGAKNYPRLGYVTVRAMLLVYTLSIPMAMLWFDSRPLLRAFSQPDNVSDLAAAFTREMVPSLIATPAFESLRRFLLAQRITSPALLCSMTSLIFHPLWLYLFVVRWKVGFLGVARANVVSSIFNIVLLLVYLTMRRPHVQGTWAGFHKRELFRGWKEFLKLSAGGVGMVTLEGLKFEIISLRAGSLGELALAMQNVTGTVAVVVFLLSAGVGAGVQTLVGNSVGASSPQSAKASHEIHLRHKLQRMCHPFVWLESRSHDERHHVAAEVRMDCNRVELLRVSGVGHDLASEPRLSR
eukprot:c11387_g1_i1.p1 GENE.c11387_g1_i1~~c11387_g1_i1.p1  ORF type:complete len:392 (+),score=70.21 c11387_g1_i1:85-1260(+)